MAEKQQYYSIKDIWQCGAQYCILNGERSNGKSYGVKAAVLYVAYHEKDPYTGEKVENYQFGYIRRRDKEINGIAILEWLQDMVKDRHGIEFVKNLTGGEYDCFDYYRQYIYFAKTDEDGKKIRGKQIGRGFAINMEEQYKSKAFPQIDYLIFEEYITTHGYLAHEAKWLDSIISTILRRDSGKIFLIGNTLSRSCPYFGAWGLVNAIKQKPGTIDIYEHATDQQNEDGSPVIVKIAVEYCENVASNTKMFFGQSAKMITSGSWYSEEQPELPRPFEEYEKLAKYFFYFSSLGWDAWLLWDNDGNFPLVYVTETDFDGSLEDLPEDQRVLSDVFTLSPRVTKRWDSRFKWDAIFHDLLRNNKAAYADNLTGTEFKQMLKDNCLY